MPPIALLLDFDGVLRRWRTDDALIERHHGLPAGAIRSVAFSPAFLTPAISGMISDEVWRARVAAELQAQYPQSLAQQAVSQWSASAGALDPAVLAVLSRCRPELRLVLATNATSRLSADLHRLGLADRFHAVANSSELGAIKPSAAYFEAALHRADVHAADALFVDDSLSNVQAASAMGIRAHHFMGHEAMSEFLREAGAFAEQTR